MSAMIEVSQVNKSYGQHHVLKNVTFSVNEGEGFAIIGPNGAGKTTMMDIITGKTRPDSGTVYFEGNVDLTQLDEASIAELGINSSPLR